MERFYFIFEEYLLNIVVHESSTWTETMSQTDASENLVLIRDDVRCAGHIFHNLVVGWWWIWSLGLSLSISALKSVLLFLGVKYSFCFEPNMFVLKLYCQKDETKGKKTYSKVSSNFRATFIYYIQSTSITTYRAAITAKLLPCIITFYCDTNWIFAVEIRDRQTDRHCFL